MSLTKLTSEQRNVAINLWTLGSKYDEDRANEQRGLRHLDCHCQLEFPHLKHPVTVSCPSELSRCASPTDKFDDTGAVKNTNGGDQGILSSGRVRSGFSTQCLDKRVTIKTTCWRTQPQSRDLQIGIQAKCSCCTSRFRLSLSMSSKAAPYPPIGQDWTSMS